MPKLFPKNLSVINCAACNNKRANILTKAEYPSYPKGFIKNALTTKSMRQLL